MWPLQTTPMRKPQEKKKGNRFKITALFTMRWPCINHVYKCKHSDYRTHTIWKQEIWTTPWLFTFTLPGIWLNNHQLEEGRTAAEMWKINKEVCKRLKKDTAYKLQNASHQLTLAVVMPLWRARRLYFCFSAKPLFSRLRNLSHSCHHLVFMCSFIVVNNTFKVCVGTQGPGKAVIVG